jgi:hypothetical protein
VKVEIYGYLKKKQNPIPNKQTPAKQSRDKGARGIGERDTKIPPKRFKIT